MKRRTASPGVVQPTARLNALCWARQRRDAGEPAPDLRKLMAQVLREVRR